MNATYVLFKKELVLFARDKTAIIMVFLVPFLLIAIMGNIFGNLAGAGDGPSMRVKLAVGLEDTADPAAQTLLQLLRDEESLEILESQTDDLGNEIPFSAETLRSGIVDRRYNFALFIPKDFVKPDAIGLNLRLFYNPRNDIETQMLTGLTQKAIFTGLPKLLAEPMDQRTREHLGDATYDRFLDGMAALFSLVAPEVSYDELRPNMGFAGLARALDEAPWQEDGEDSESSAEKASGFLDGIVDIEKDQIFGKDVQNPELTRIIGGYAIMFLLFAVTGSSTSLFEEKNDGLFARLLSMPLKRQHILWSKYLFNTALGIVQILTLFFFASLLFDIQIYRNFGSLLTVAIVSALACTAFGMAIASVARTAAQAQGFGTLLILSMSSLGGAWWPVEFMSEPLQILARFTVVYWGVQGFMGALWEDLSVFQLLPEIGMVLLFAILLNALSLWRFRQGDLFR